MGKVWTLQDAERSLPALAGAAADGEPQRIATAEGDVIVLSVEQYELMARRPKTFIEHLMDFPKLPADAQDMFDKPEPMIVEMRDIDFGD